MNLNALMGDYVELNPHQIAWKSRDWKAIDKLIKEFDVDEENEFFETLGALTYTKERLNASALSYSKRNIDNAMSQHADCMYPTFVMNLIGDSITDQMHYDYYLHTISQGKRYGKWAKTSEDMEIKVILRLISVYYEINNDCAVMYKSIMDRKETLSGFLKKAKPLANEQFIKNICKTKADQGKMLKIIEKW